MDTLTMIANDLAFMALGAFIFLVVLAAWLDRPFGEDYRSKEDGS